MSAPTADTITVHEAIVQAIASCDNLDSSHGQLCPTWRLRATGATIWDCNCWRLGQIKRCADAICAALDGDA